MKSFPFLIPALATGCLLSLSIIPAWAAASQHQPAVSFSPSTINFGQVPSNEDQTQLLTVTFRRPAFQPDHLPALRPQPDNGDIRVTLFSRSDGVDTITFIYRVTISGLRLAGPFHLSLVLAIDSRSPSLDPVVQEAESEGVPVVGSVVQGLNAKKMVSFDRVQPGKGATQELTVGVYGLSMIPFNVRKSGTAASAPPDGPGLGNTSVTSSSPYVTAQFKGEMGLNGSHWETWQISLSPQTPAEVLQAELQFRTGNGYYVTVPVYADVSSLGGSEPASPRKP